MNRKPTDSLGQQQASPLIDIVIGDKYWLYLNCTLTGFLCWLHLGHFPAVILRNLEFEDDQKAHQQSQLKILRSAHQDIADIMTRIHKTFANDGPEVCAAFDLFSGSIPSEMCLHFEKVVIRHIYKIVILDLLCNRAAQFNDKSQLAIFKSQEAAIFC